MRARISRSSSSGSHRQQRLPNWNAQQRRRRRRRHAQVPQCTKRVRRREKAEAEAQSRRRRRFSQKGAAICEWSTLLSVTVALDRQLVSDVSEAAAVRRPAAARCPLSARVRRAATRRDATRRDATQCARRRRQTRGARCALCNLISFARARRAQLCARPTPPLLSVVWRRRVFVGGARRGQVAVAPPGA